MKLDLSNQAVKFLDRLDAKPFRQIDRKLQELAKQGGSPDSRPLKGYSYLRADCGEYRIVYRIVAGTVKIALIAKRNDGEVYWLLKRLD